jgi:hypothetical protein
MAAVTGPTSRLPGDERQPPQGQMCDTPGHEKTPAYRRVTGECDSLGSESIDFCLECYHAFLEAKKTADTSGVCDICGKHSASLRKRRDPEEGSCGRVYDTCKSCYRNLDSEE